MAYQDTPVTKANTSEVQYWIRTDGLPSGAQLEEAESRWHLSPFEKDGVPLVVFSNDSKLGERRNGIPDNELGFVANLGPSDPSLYSDKPPYGMKGLDEP